MSSRRRQPPSLPNPASWDPYLRRSSDNERVQVGGQSASRRAVGTLLIQSMKRVGETSRDYRVCHAGLNFLVDGCRQLDSEIAAVVAKQLQRNGGRLWPRTRSRILLRAGLPPTSLTPPNSKPAPHMQQGTALKPPTSGTLRDFHTPGDHGQHRAHWAPYSDNTE